MKNYLLNLEFRQAQASLNNVWQYIEQNANCLTDDDSNSLFTLKQRFLF